MAAMESLSRVTPRRSNTKQSSTSAVADNVVDLVVTEDANERLVRVEDDVAIKKKKKKDSHYDTISVSKEKDDDVDSVEASSLLQTLQRKYFPHIQRLRNQAQRIPPRYKFFCFVLWILWKFVAAYILMSVLSAIRGSGGSSGSERNALAGGTNSNNAAPPAPLKILYIVTSLAEYNTGQRQTVAGQDRLADVVLPVLVDSVESMVLNSEFNNIYQVDVMLILAYKLRPERRAMIRRHLPSSVGLDVWDDACPLGYDVKHSTTRLKDNTRALSRQHRYAIKDRLPYYDLFLAFEDDMRITGHHVHQFVTLSNQLERLQQATPVSLDETLPTETVGDYGRAGSVYNATFFGPMARRRLLERLIPGFIRVEVLLNASEHGAQRAEEKDPIAINHEFLVNSTLQERHFDPSFCCHHQMSVVTTMKEAEGGAAAAAAAAALASVALPPPRPDKEDVIVWETSVKALSARRLPPLVPSQNTTVSVNDNLDWVILLPGPGKNMPDNELMGGYWSGREGAYGKDATKPAPGMPDLIAQQGGWMALTRQQLLRINHDQRRCMGTLLPPFDGPMYRADGQESMNVEFWSGGYQLFTGVRGGCNMQRFIPFSGSDDIDTAFSKHFIYHVANNKQKQLARRRMVRANDLFGQLNTVVQMAQAEEKRLRSLDKSSSTTSIA